MMNAKIVWSKNKYVISLFWGSANCVTFKGSFRLKKKKVKRWNFFTNFGKLYGIINFQTILAAYTAGKSLMISPTVWAVPVNVVTDFLAAFSLLWTRVYSDAPPQEAARSLTHDPLGAGGTATHRSHNKPTLAHLRELGRSLNPRKPNVRLHRRPWRWQINLCWQVVSALSAAILKVFNVS